MSNPTLMREKVRRQSATEQLDEMITELSARCKLEGWEQLVEECTIPSDLLPALMTGRRELLAAVQPRAMTAEEVGHLYKLLIVLMETNMALQQHAQQVAQQVHIWTDAFKQLHSVGNRIEHFANFRRTDQSDESDDMLV
jgi:hypothetical protein